MHKRTDLCIVRWRSVRWNSWIFFKCEDKNIYFRHETAKHIAMDHHHQHMPKSLVISIENLHIVPKFDWRFAIYTYPLDTTLVYDKQRLMANWTCFASFGLLLFCDILFTSRANRAEWQRSANAHWLSIDSIRFRAIESHNCAPHCKFATIQHSEARESTSRPHWMRAMRYTFEVANVVGMETWDNWITHN